MRKGKFFLLSFIAFAIIILVGCNNNFANAEVNIRENGSVDYLLVPDPESLRTQINNNLLFSSNEYIDKDCEYMTNTYKIIIEEPGTLVVYPLEDKRQSSLLSFESRPYCRFNLYSDFELEQQVISKGCIPNTESNPILVHLEPGTYYYNSTLEYKIGVNMAVYLGLIPDAGLNRSQFISYSEKEYPEVKYAIVKSCDDLARCIDRDMAASSADRFVSGDKSIGNIYQFTIESRGAVVFAPIEESEGLLGRNENLTRIKFYSNADLTSLISQFDSIQSTEELFTYFILEPGTYYYYAYKWNGVENIDLSVYIGFIPYYTDDEDFNSDNIQTSYETFQHDSDLPELTLHNFKSEEDFINQIDMANPDIRLASNAVVSLNIKDSTLDYLDYRIHLDESGYLHIYSYFSEKYYFSLRLYNNSLKHSCLLCETVDKKEPTKDSVYSIFLEAGDYYFRIFKNNGGRGDVALAFVGFVPTSAVISVESIEYNENKTEAYVTFSVTDEYNPDTGNALIRVIRQEVAPRSKDRKATWNYQDRKNAIESHVFTTNKNGIYTARIAGTGLDTYLLVFEINGLVENNTLDSAK